MDVTVVPPLLSKAGKAAQSVADGSLTTAWGELDAAERAAQAAHLVGFESNAALGSLTATYMSAAEGIRGKSRSAGGKLVTTANVYASTDDVNADIFHRVPVPTHGNLPE